MYSQSRSSGINLGESEDAQFKQEWRQQKTKMCVEEHMLVSRTEKHQNDVIASPKLQSFNYPYNPTSLDRGIEKGTITNGYENDCHSGDNGSTDSSGGNNGPVSDNNHYVSLEFSGDIYENDGDTFRTHSEFDKSLVVLERSDDVLNDNMHQLWTDNITGGTSRKEYIDMNLYRPNCQHGSSNSLQSARRIGLIENRSVDTETQNLYQNEKGNDKKKNKTCLVVISGILLIACIAGVLAWFLAKKGDDEFPVKYYAICNDSNGSDVYVPHEKIDGCKSYVRCYKNIPTGQLCGHGDLCFDHQNKYCNWCADVSCESEMSPTADDVSFEIYKLESYIGSQVSMKCLAHSANSIKAILILKIDSPVKHMVANVTLPAMTSHIDGTTVSFTNNSLTLTFTSTNCSDDGQYTCIVIKEDESQIESPAYLRIQLSNPPTHEAVVFILNPDIKENKYDTSNVHTCSGDVGYPSGLGYLSLKFTDPTTNASFSYDKMTVTEDMKIALDSPLKFKVSLSSGLSIIIVEDDEPDIVNCTRMKEIKFLLQATRDWNRAKIRCRVISETNEVNSTSAEKELYVIPDAVCDGSNGSDIYVPHEKIDHCRTYIRCFNNIPTGQFCGGIADTCFDHQINRCNWCSDVACESEMSPTTEGQIMTTTSLPAVPEIQCPLLSCKPSSVFEMETANIVCELNTSMTYDNITVVKTGQAIMTVFPNGTNHYFSDEIEKYDSTVGTSFTFVIKNVSCSDENEYTFTVEVGEGGSCYKTASLEMKAKPAIPTLAIDYRWTEGTNLGTHSCTGSIGNPPGTMTLEIRDRETGNFTSFSPSTKSLNTIKENCHYDAKLTFSINFNTENIRSNFIRCVANNQHTLSISEFPFYSREVFVNPLPANACFENGLHPYPGDCTRFLNCYGNVTSVTQCPSGLCYESVKKACDNDCIRCST